MGELCWTGFNWLIWVSENCLTVNSYSDTLRKTRFLLGGAGNQKAVTLQTSFCLAFFVIPDNNRSTEDSILASGQNLKETCGLYAAKRLCALISTLLKYPCALSWGAIYRSGLFWGDIRRRLPSLQYDITVVRKGKTKPFVTLASSQVLSELAASSVVWWTMWSAHNKVCGLYLKYIFLSTSQLPSTSMLHIYIWHIYGRYLQYSTKIKTI